jgi:hypothetical protein
LVLRNQMLMMVFAPVMSYASRVNVGRHTTVLAILLTGVPVLAELPAESNYRVILERNPFGLKDPLPETKPDPSTTNVAVKVDIKLTGISGDGAAKRAWLVIPPSGPVKPGQAPPQPKYLSLREGDEHDALKVLEIDARAATVKILNAGQTVSLNFKDNALPLTVVAPPVGTPGPTGNRPGQPPGLGKPVSPVTTPTIAPAGTIPTADGGGMQPGIQTPTGLKPIPARNVRASSATTTVAPQTAAPIQQQSDPATQYLQMRAAEELARRYGVQYPPPAPPGPWNASE